MDFNTILMLVGLAVFILPVTYMLGHARHEKQAKHTINAIKADNVLAFEILDASWHDTLTRERNVIRELEIALLQAGLAVEAESNAFKGMKDQWAYSNGYRKALVQAMLDFGLWDFGKHRDDPAAMIKLLREHAAMLAVDPQLNKAAKNLHTRGVRAGAKRGRLQMQKTMRALAAEQELIIDNQALSIEASADFAQRQASVISAQSTEHDIYRAAVENTIADKIALPGVRKAFKTALRVELDRMKAVNRFIEE